MVTIEQAGGAIATAAWVGGVVKGLVDAVKKVIPALDKDVPIWGIAHLPARALAVVLSAGLVVYYHVNLPAQGGMPSSSGVVDTVMTVVAVALASMGINDGLNLWAPPAPPEPPAPPTPPGP